MRLLLILCVWACVSRAGLAQGEVTPVLPPAVPPPAVLPPRVVAVTQESAPNLTKLQRAEATKLLGFYAEQSRGVDVLVADYIQRRTTTLSKRPLLSSGGFLFVRKPACVVFRASKPRHSVVRLTSSLYEVFRPRRKRLERFALGGLDLAQGLFAAVGGDAKQLLADFDIVGFSSTRPDQIDDDELGSAVIRLVPKSKIMRERLRELLIQLHVTIDKKPNVTLHSVSYRDQSGDLVAIELAKLRKNPKDPPSAEIDVPADTQVMEHGVGR